MSPHSNLGHIVKSIALVLVLTFAFWNQFTSYLADPSDYGNREQYQTIPDYVVKMPMSTCPTVGNGTMVTTITTTANQPSVLIYPDATR
jgi:hypothetical protein